MHLHSTVWTYGKAHSSVKAEVIYRESDDSWYVRMYDEFGKLVKRIKAADQFQGVDVADSYLKSAK